MQLTDYENFPSVLPIIFEENFLYPFMISPLFVTNDEDIKAVEYAINNNKLLVIGVLKNTDKKEKAFYDVAVAGNIMRKVSLPDGRIKVLFQGLTKVKILNVNHSIPLQVTVDELKTNNYDQQEVSITLELLKNKIESYARLNRAFPIDLIKTIDDNNEPHRIVDIISSALRVDVKNAYKLLKETDILKRLYILIDIVEKEIKAIKLKTEITKKVNHTWN